MFLQLFQDTLGPKVLVAVPNRYTAYVFPAPQLRRLRADDFQGLPCDVFSSQRRDLRIQRRGH